MQSLTTSDIGILSSSWTSHLWCRSYNLCIAHFTKFLTERLHIAVTIFIVRSQKFFQTALLTCRLAISNSRSFEKPPHGSLLIYSYNSLQTPRISVSNTFGYSTSSQLHHRSFPHSDRYSTVQCLVQQFLADHFIFLFCKCQAITSKLLVISIFRSRLYSLYFALSIYIRTNFFINFFIFSLFSALNFTL